MELIGRIGNILYHYISGARIMVDSKLDDVQLSNVVDYGDVKSYSSIYFLELAYFGESQFNETPAITDDDKIAYMLAQ